MLGFLGNLYKWYINSNWARVITLIILGLVLLTIHLSYQENTNSHKGFTYGLLLPLIGALGKTILAGGFLAFFLKSFQFIGIFRDEISKIIFAKDFLTKTTKTYKEEVWKNITNSLYQSSFPKISNKIANIIYDKYVPKGLEFYYENMTVIYEFEKVGDNHIAIIEKQTFTIRSEAKGIDFLSESYIWKKNEVENLTDIQIIKLTVNGKDIAQAPWLKTDNSVIDGHIEKMIKVNKLLEGQHQYNVVYNVKSIHSSKLNVYWKTVMAKYVKNFEIVIKENSNFVIDFIPFGLNINLRCIPDSEIRKHDDLLIPGEGYVIILKNKTH
jgi:hypothetical protein